MKIILLRHGEPDFTAHWLSTKGGASIALESYAASRVSIAPPTQLCKLPFQVDICVTSNLARAMDSAKLLGFNNSIALALFNESALPHPNRFHIPLPWSLFTVFYRVLWFFGFRQNCEGKLNDRHRARKASRHLCELASKHGFVLLVGHGVMNRLLCSELKKLGWSIDSKNGRGYWSSITLSGPTPELSVGN